MVSIYHLTIADYAVIVIFFIITCTIGVFYAWKDRHSLKTENAFVGNKSFKLVPIACSLLVTQISAILILGLPAEFYTRGAQYWVYIIAQWLGVIVALYLFLPVFFRVNSPSSFTYLEKRFRSPVLRSYCALTFVISQILYASVVLYAPCLAISIMVTISITKLLLIVGGICTFYTAIGGFKTVIFTDLFQFLVIFSAITGLLIKGSVNAGGIGSVFETAHRLGRMGSTFDFHPDPTRYQTVWTIFFGIFFLTVRAYGVYQPSVQRFVSMPTLKKARWSLYLVLPMQLVLFFILSTLGFVMLASNQDCDPLSLKVVTKKDHLLSLFAAETFGHLRGLQGLFLACLFSGSLSTLSSSFNSLAAVMWEDFLLPLKPEWAQVSEGRGLVTLLPGILAFTFGLICVGLSFLAQHVEGILNAAFNALSVFGGQAISVFFLGMFARRTNYKGVIAGKVVADIICIWITIGLYRYSSVITPPYLPIPPPKDLSSCASRFSGFNQSFFAIDGNGLAANGIPNPNFGPKPYFLGFSNSNANQTTSQTLTILSTSLPNSNFTTAFNGSRPRPMERIMNNPIEPGLGNYILFKIYSISYLLISPLGFIICTIVGLLVSKLTGGNKDPDLDYDWKNLLHPWLVNDIHDSKGDMDNCECYFMSPPPPTTEHQTRHRSLDPNHAI